MSGSRSRRLLVSVGPGKVSRWQELAQGHSHPATQPKLCAPRPPTSPAPPSPRRRPSNPGIPVRRAGVACTRYYCLEVHQSIHGWPPIPERLSPGDSRTTAPCLLIEDGLLHRGAIGLQLPPPLCREVHLADGLCLGDIGQEFLLERVSHNLTLSHSWSKSAGSPPVPSPGGVDRGVTKTRSGHCLHPAQNRRADRVAQDARTGRAATRHPLQPRGL